MESAPSRLASTRHEWQGVSNATSYRTDNSHTTPHVTPTCKVMGENIFYMTIYCAIIILVFAGNIFILKTVIPLKKRKTSRYRNIDLFIVYLASFDLMATLMITVDVYENLTCFVGWPFGLFACKIVYPCYHISLGMTVCILALMSIDRCRSITRPLHEKFAKRSIHLAVFFSFILSTGLQWYQFRLLGITPEGICNADKTRLDFAIPRLFTIFLRDFVLLITFTVTTILIYRSMKKQEKKIQHHSISKRGAHSVVSMLIVMEVAFILLVMPYDVYDCAMLLSRIMPGVEPIQPTLPIYRLDRFLSMLQMSNSFANCFIYAKMHKQIKERSSYSSCNRYKLSNLTVSVLVSSKTMKSVCETRLSTDFEASSPPFSSPSSRSSRSSTCMTNTSHL